MRKQFDILAKPKVYIIHENEAWVVPLKKALSELHTPFEEWFLDEGQIDLNSAPPSGIFYNRMSASSHTRGHRYAVELTGPILAWLETHNRRVINNRRALQLEVRKFEQYLSLQQHGLSAPRTIAAVGKSQIVQAAKTFGNEPFIIKPNRGGKGLGVQLFKSIKSLESYLDEITIEELTLDGVVLVQQYVKPADQTITRMEFVNGTFLYAVKVDASGGFELCPADECLISDLACPADSNKKKDNKFKIIEDFRIPEIVQCENFLKANGIEIAAIEFVEDVKGRRFIYDINTNTNYNSDAEKRSKDGKEGMVAIAHFLSSELQKVYHSLAPRLQVSTM